MIIARVGLMAMILAITPSALGDYVSEDFSGGLEGWAAGPNNQATWSVVAGALNASGTLVENVPTYSPWQDYIDLSFSPVQLGDFTLQASTGFFGSDSAGHNALGMALLDASGTSGYYVAFSRYAGTSWFGHMIRRVDNGVWSPTPMGGGLLAEARYTDTLEPAWTRESVRTYDASGNMVSETENPAPYRINDNRHTITLSRSGDVLTFTMRGANSSWGHSESISVADPHDELLTSFGTVRLFGVDTSYGFLFDNVTLTDSPAAPQERPADFGQQWVRNNPFSIMGASHQRGIPSSFNVDQYLGAGLNVVFANFDPAVAQAAADAGVSWHGHGEFSEFNSAMMSPHAGGFMVRDEPWNPTDMALAAEKAQLLREVYPGMLNYVNALPFSVFPTAEYTYDQYLDDIVHVVKSDVLMFDFYPFYKNGGTDRAALFHNAIMVRNKALQNNLPYWAWLQSYKDPGQVNYRTPSESDTRFNAFSLLTFGYTGLNYWMFSNETADFAGTFFDSDGNPTAFYDYAAASNREVSNLGRSLRFLTSTDVRIVNGSNPTAVDVANWTVGAGDDTHIVSIGVDMSNPNNQGVSKDGLIGFFVDDEGQQYFMLTNLYQGASLSAEEAALSFVVAFDESVNSIWRMNRLTEMAEEIALDGHTLYLTLPGGTGDLFKYDNGNFPIPEPTSLVLLSLGALMIVRQPCRR